MCSWSHFFQYELSFLWYFLVWHQFFSKVRKVEFLKLEVCLVELTDASCEQGDSNCLLIFIPSAELNLDRNANDQY